MARTVGQRGYNGVSKLLSTERVTLSDAVSLDRIKWQESVSRPLSLKNKFRPEELARPLDARREVRTCNSSWCRFFVTSLLPDQKRYLSCAKNRSRAH